MFCQQAHIFPRTPIKSILASDYWLDLIHSPVAAALKMCVGRTELVTITISSNHWAYPNQISAPSDLMTLPSLTRFHNKFYYFKIDTYIKNQNWSSLCCQLCYSSIQRLSLTRVHMGCRRSIKAATGQVQQTEHIPHPSAWELAIESLWRRPSGHGNMSRPPHSLETARKIPYRVRNPRNSSGK
jgi:hypothetical protein